MSKEYEIHQDGMMVAGASGKNALADALHYCAVYGQDGPVELFEVTRVQVGTDGVALAASAPNAALLAALRKIKQNETEVFDEAMGEMVVVGLDAEEMVAIAAAALSAAGQEVDE